MAKILIVEDDPVVLRLYSNLFTLEKYIVMTASNGRECVQIAEKDKPDLILLDVMMPEMDGYATLQLLQSNADLWKIPVVMLTNLSGRENEEEAYKRGAVKFFVKSDIDNTKLVQSVRDILSSVAASGNA